MSNNGIPTPAFQSSRSKRRSSIGQGAALSAASDEGSGAVPLVPAPAQAATTDAPRPRPVSGRSDRDPAKGSAPPAGESTNKRLVGSKDILLSLPEDLKTRMVNTITWSHPYTGIGQQQKFIRKAIADLCERLEQQHNQGKPFPEPVVHDD
ncbi:hypothetical protein ACX9NJ_27685 [Mycobacterium sp. ML2]